MENMYDDEMMPFMFAGKAVALATLSVLANLWIFF